MNNPEQGTPPEAPNPEARGCLRSLVTLAGYGVALLPAVLAYMSPDDHTDPKLVDELNRYNPFIKKTNKK